MKFPWIKISSVASPFAGTWRITLVWEKNNMNSISNQGGEGWLMGDPEWFKSNIIRIMFQCTYSGWST